MTADPIRNTLIGQPAGALLDVHVRRWLVEDEATSMKPAARSCPRQIARFP